jgi:hypothetical protein
MTVAELIAELQQLDPEALVVQSKDGEGNSYSPLADVSFGWYLPDSTWSGEWMHDGAENEPEYEWEGPTDKDVRAVCLWPTN